MRAELKNTTFEKWIYAMSNPTVFVWKWKKNLISYNIGPLSDVWELRKCVWAEDEVIKVSDNSIPNLFFCKKHNLCNRQTRQVE